MSVEVDVEHLFCEVECGSNDLRAFKAVLDRNGFDIATVDAYDENYRSRPISYDSIVTLPRSHWASVLARNENLLAGEKIPLGDGGKRFPLGIDFHFSIRLPTDEGYMLETDAAWKEGWLLSYNVGIGAVMDLEDKFDLEKLAKDVHSALRPLKTVCHMGGAFPFSPGQPGYEEAKKYRDKILQEHGGDHVFWPLIQFAIVRPELYGGEDRLVSEIRTIRANLPTSDIKAYIAKRSFPLEVDHLPNGDLFLKYSPLM